jgi:thymidine kinase
MVFEFHIYTGPMFSGKSSELLRQMSRYKAIGKRVLLINHSNDTRTDDFIETHNHHKQEAIKVTHLMELVNKDMLQEYDIIAIDEAQFFTDLKEFILAIERTDKIVYVAGLDGDSNRNPFGQILDCIPLCDSVVKLRALDMITCDGNTKAPFTKRIVNKNNLQIQIGAKESYKAVSRENYFI